MKASKLDGFEKKSMFNDFKKNSLIGGQWNVSSLVVYGRTRRSIHLITSFHLKRFHLFHSPLTLGLLP
jgi:hypothetical protein